MPSAQPLAQRFENHRAHLRRVAYRMLGSSAEADDAVQEAWLRLSRSDPHDVANLGGWLTTVVARVCLDILRARRARGEESIEDEAPPAPTASAPRTPEEEAELAEAVGMAMLVVLDTLAPAERVALVLHDMFDLTFDEIAPVVGRTPVATRQLASRARRRVRGTPVTPPADRARQQEVVEAFLAASRGGDFEALIGLLDPEVVFRPDDAAMKLGRQGAVGGADAVARLFVGRAQAAQPGLINDNIGLIVAPNGKLLLVLALTFDGDRIVEIEAVADRASLAELELEPVERGG